MSQRKDSRFTRLITKVAKRLGTPFWEDLRRVANTVMAFGIYAPVVYPDRWMVFILMPLLGFTLWVFAFKMERRSKECE
ncbi:hypothetical protein EGT07_23830 [Herbaspirillum sp. HC18]|nr:hypothetical protein EGT07_23830 [Herbaspirillum sp. HC18]